MRLQELLMLLQGLLLPDMDAVERLVEGVQLVAKHGPHYGYAQEQEQAHDGAQALHRRLAASH
jgi:hypothetical protein